MDVQGLDRRAVGRSVEVVRAVRADQLDLPTPCAKWALRDLLAHMTGQHHGFAAAAEGRGQDLAEWRDRPVPEGSAAGAAIEAYAAAADRVTAAFADPGVLERQFWLPEVSTGTPFPGRLAVSFHLIDYLVHSWDVAVTIGVPPGLDDDLVAAGVAIATQVPDDDSRRQPGAAFAPALAPPAGASAQDRMLALLGRSPRWPD